MKNFVIRTVRNGQVLINKHVFVPSEQYLKYDGRLDGKRYSFGLYYNGEEMCSFVSLWGTEATYKNSEIHQYGDECVDGTLPWLFWKFN